MLSVLLFRVAYGQVREPSSYSLLTAKHLLTIIRLDILPIKLQHNLPASLLPQLPDIVGSVGLALNFDWGTPERSAINQSYDETFRILLIIGICAQAAALFASLCIKDLNLKTLDETRDYGGMVIGRTGAAANIRDQVRGTRHDESAAKEGSV
jgi:hypothetical protein